MADKTITLKLQGGVTLDAFSFALEQFSKLVAALCADAKAKGMKWDVTGLEAGSAVITARADVDEEFTDEQADFVVTSYARVGKELAKHSALSDYKARVRRPALALAGVATWGPEEVVFETSEEDVLIRPAKPEMHGADRQEGEPIPFPASAYGSVTGRVQSLSNRGGLRFTIYEVMSDRAVSCYLAAGSESTMIDAWGQLATVEGDVSRDPATGRPIAVRHIENVHINDECEVEGYKSARGAVVPLPGADLPEDIIRRLRDAN